MGAMGLAARSDERADDHPGQHELHICREPTLPVPAKAIMKELSPAWTQEGEDVLEVRCGTCDGAKRRRIEWPSPRGEEKDASETAADLEATGAEVFMRQAIAREMDDWPQKERRESRPARSTDGSASRHVECDDHGRASPFSS